MASEHTASERRCYGLVALFGMLLIVAGTWTVSVTAGLIGTGVFFCAMALGMALPE